MTQGHAAAGSGVVPLQRCVQRGIVEHCADDVGVHFAEAIYRLFGVFALGVSRAHYQEHAIHLGRQDHRVGDDGDRWRVKQDHVGALDQSFNDGLHAARAE